MILLQSPCEHQLVHTFLRLFQNPSDFQAIYDLDEVIRQHEISIISREYLKSQPEVAQLIRDRYQPPVPDLAQLLTYPPESLGHQFAQHMKTNGFEVQFYRQRDFDSDISYITLRRSQTHDIQHVITGFGTDLPGEMGLQALQFAQMRSPLAIALMASTMVNLMHTSTPLQTTMDYIYRGWQMGLKAKPLFAQRWEEQWQKPLVEWQTELGIEPIG